MEVSCFGSARKANDMDTVASRAARIIAITVACGFISAPLQNINRECGSSPAGFFLHHVDLDGVFLF